MDHDEDNFLSDADHYFNMCGLDVMDDRILHEEISPNGRFKSVIKSFLIPPPEHHTHPLIMHQIIRLVDDKVLVSIKHQKQEILWFEIEDEDWAMISRTFVNLTNERIYSEYQIRGTNFDFTPYWPHVFKMFYFKNLLFVLSEIDGSPHKYDFYFLSEDGDLRKLTTDFIFNDFRFYCFQYEFVGDATPYLELSEDNSIIHWKSPYCQTLDMWKYDIEELTYIRSVESRGEDWKHSYSAVEVEERAKLMDRYMKFEHTFTNPFPQGRNIADHFCHDYGCRLTEEITHSYIVRHEGNNVNLNVTFDYVTKLKPFFVDPEMQ
jgi:hypothetical protein